MENISTMSTKTQISRADQIMEKRNKAFRVLYDTVVEIEGASEEKIFSLLCTNLMKITNADCAAVASYYPEPHALRLEWVVTKNNTGPANNEYVGKVNIISNSVSNNLIKNRIKKCEDHNGCLVHLFNHSIFNKIKSHNEGSCYQLSCVHENVLLAVWMIQFNDDNKLRLKDIVDTYMNMAGIIIQRVYDERSIRESEEKYRNVVERANDGIIIVVDKLIKYSNPRISAITGFSIEEYSNALFSKLFDPKELKKVSKSYKSKNSDDNVPSIFETKIICKDGTIKYVEMNSGRIFYQGEQAFLVIMRDITERKIMESHLNHAQKLESIGQLAAGIAHEINTPIQFVGDNLRFLQDSFKEITYMFNKYKMLLKCVKENKITSAIANEVEEYSEEIDIEYLLDEIPNAINQSLDGSSRVTKIVNAMKEFSHPGVEGKTAIDINKTIDSTITVARSEWKNIANIKTEYDDNLPLIPCFPSEFNQVILNILLNATQAIEDAIKDNPESKGTITINTSQSNCCIVIKISDTGNGIPKEIQPKIFDPFFTTKDVGKGTGQGLAISHDVIVRKHGGTITFETEKDKGTTFIIRLLQDSCDNTE